MRTVRVWLGLGSRYSYLAATQLRAIEERHGVRFEWLPINSVRLVRDARGGASPFDDPKPIGQYDREWRDEDAARWAEYYGVPYVTPDLDGVNMDAVAEACWAAPDDGVRADVCRAFHTAIFAEGRRPEAGLIAEVAVRFGFDPGEAEARARHEAALGDAVQAGVFGVPTFDAGGAFFWGNDRLVLLERHLERGEA